MPEHQDGLDQTRHAGSRLEVPEIGLDRTDRQRAVIPGSAIDPPDGFRLDWITDRGAGAVRLEVVHLARLDGRLLQHPSHQLGLPGHAGDGQPGLARTVGVHAAAQNHRVNTVTGRFGIFQALEHQHRAALGTHIAVTRRVKGPTAALRRKHGRLGEANKGIRVQQQVHAAHDHQRTLAETQTVAGLVQCDQRRRAGGVHRHRGTVQIEKVGQAVGRNAQGIPGHRVRVHHRQVIETAHAVIDTRDTDEYSGIAAPQRRWEDAGVFQRLPCQFQQQALLRVHQHRLARRNAEERRVETIDIRQHASLESDAAARLAHLGVAQFIHRPATYVDLANQVPLSTQCTPKVFPARYTPPESAGPSLPAPTS